MKTSFTVIGDLPRVMRDDQDLFPGTLEYYFGEIVVHAKNVCGHFHVFEHIFDVTYRCYEALLWLRAVFPDPAEEFYISPEDALTLMLAAPHHDVDHTNLSGTLAIERGCWQGDPREYDQVNMDAAFAFMDRHFLPEHQPLLPRVKQTIYQATFFPHKYPGKKLPPIAKILRDCDVTYLLSPVWIQRLMGLGAEMGKTLPEMLAMQRVFLTPLKNGLLTPWARSMYTPALIDGKIEEAEELLRMYRAAEVRRDTATVSRA